MGSTGRARLRLGRSEVEATDGEPLLAAVGRRGWPSLVRSVRYHRPRGPFCGVGDCTGCLVRVNGVPNQRSCLRPARDGDVVELENSWPSPRLDVYGVADLLLPHGLDTVHGLRRPAVLRSAYQRVVRRLAGFGAAPDPGSARPPAPARWLRTDALVVGGGRSGRAIAGELASAGRRPLLVERRADGAPLGGVELLAGVTATMLAAGGAEGDAGFTLLGFTADGAGVAVRSPTVVVAAGAYDAGLAFEGSDRPGIVTADLALSGLGLALGTTVVFGGGERARAVLERAPGEVEAVVAPGEIRPELARSAAERGIDLFPRTRLVRAIGRGHLRGVELARRDGAGRFRLATRSLVLAHRRLPNAQLAYQLGAERAWDAGAGAFVPVLDAEGRSSVPGLFIVGSAADPGATQPAAPATVARAVVSGPSPRGPPVPRAPASRPGELASYYRETLAEARHGKTVVCPCEDVLLTELEEAVRRGYRGLEVVKRYTGVGTGLCQGRYCLPEALVVLSLLERRDASEVGTITQRPPLVPTPLGTLAAFAPELDAGSP
ncbi:MAG TPA: 2Fe-2S iron-sulfur cluster-binding protein [Thermoplasmata archaeon]|nr:2Fe-2S iron-sulfur cluster-binding protein [Thermoplasmata archaeon]